MFQIEKISNGWLLKCQWTEQGQPRIEQLFMKDPLTVANTFVVWATEGFEAAVQHLAEMKRKEDK